MDLIGIGSILEGVGKIAGDLVTTDKERNELELEGRKLDLEQARIDQATDLAQVEVNKIEAASTNLFTSGWRPFVGWTCGAGFAVQFVIGPLGEWMLSVAGLQVKFPPMDLGTMTPLLFGMLGLGAYRTAEKVKGVAS
jgi:hypothetical protein